MWGSDHAISLEPEALAQMVSDIRLIEQAMGDGVKRVYESEKEIVGETQKHPVTGLT
jgi:N-acetylneuraminate synthase